MNNDRIDELAREIVFGPDRSEETEEGKSIAAMVDPTVWLGFIQALIEAFRQCRENRAKRIAKRLANDKANRRRRASLHAWLTGGIEPYMRQEQDSTTIRMQAMELAERTLDKAESMEDRELVDVIDELQSPTEL